MGGKESRVSKLPGFKRENWQLQPQNKYARAQYGLYYLYRNKLTNQQIEQYQIYFHNEAEYHKYLQFFEWRQREDSIVNSKFINSQQIKQFCNTNHNAKIYIEHIPIRLSHIEDIPYPQNLYVLFSALNGFEKIFFWVGYFEPSEDMVCVDCDGKVKVWLNADLSKCNTNDSQFADETAHFRSMPHYEEQMVAAIVQMIEQNTSDQLETDMTFTQHLWHAFKGRKLNFKQAKQEVINYSQQHNTTIPNYFESVMSLFSSAPAQAHSDEGQEQKLPLSSHRAKKEENRIITKNRASNQLGEHISQYNTTAPIDETIINSKRHQMQDSREGPFQRFRPDTEPLPSFSIVEANHVTSECQPPRPQSPPLRRGSFHQPGVLQIRFNYSPASGPPTHLPAASQSIVHVPQTVYHHNVARGYEPHPPSPIQRLPQSPVPGAYLEQGPVGVEQSSQPSKLMYSDTNDTYELDQQIAKDIMKYFGNSSY